MCIRKGLCPEGGVGSITERCRVRVTGVVAQRSRHVEKPAAAPALAGVFFFYSYAPHGLRAALHITLC